MAGMTAVAYLQKALDLIRDPDRWATGTYARDTAGEWTDVDSPAAVRWCARGGLRKVCYEAMDLNREERVRAEGVLEEVADAAIPIGVDRGDLWNPIAYVNDALGHAAVVAVFAEAIRRLGEGEHA